MIIRLILLSIIVLLYGCSTRLPATLGEEESGYGYIPLDGLAEKEIMSNYTCVPWEKRIHAGPKTDDLATFLSKSPFAPLLLALPDVSVRFAVASFVGSGGLSFGPAKVTASNQSYRAILDYVNVDAIPVRFLITAYKESKPVRLSSVKNGEADYYEATLIPAHSEVKSESKSALEGALVTIPVYVGIGLRLTADIKALEGGIPLTSLGAIAIEAEAKRLSGTLTVQSIGLTGEAVATALPLPSKLDQTTIENGILAIGSTRAVIYRSLLENGGITTTPRIVGLYSPIGSSPVLVNAIYSELARQPPEWERPCRAFPKQGE